MEDSRMNVTWSKTQAEHGFDQLGDWRRGLIHADVMVVSWWDRDCCRAVRSISMAGRKDLPGRRTQDLPSKVSGDSMTLRLAQKAGREGKHLRDFTWRRYWWDTSAKQPLLHYIPSYREPEWDLLLKALWWIRVVCLLGGFAKTDTLAKQLRVSKPKLAPFTSNQSYIDLLQWNSWFRNQNSSLVKSIFQGLDHL